VSRIRFYAGVTLLLLLAGYAGYLFERSTRNRTAALNQPDSHVLLVSDPRFLDRSQLAELRGKQASEFTLPDVSGSPRQLGEWADRVRVINFWATWCEPCIREVPGLVDLQGRYGEAGLQVIGIALQEPGEVAGFIAQYGVNYPVLTGDDEVIKIAESFGDTAGVVPYTVILDRQGRISYLRHGELDMDLVETEIKLLLK
jgi:peroxiredoxin